MRGACIGLVAGALAFLAFGASAAESQRLRSLQEERIRLQREVDRLAARERGVLGELTRLDAELALRRNQLEVATVQAEETERRMDATSRELEALEAARERVTSYLSFRLREVYKTGPHQTLRRLFGGSDARSAWQAIGYASWLSQRDARAIESLRANAERAARQREVLEDQRQELERTRLELSAAANELSRASDRRRSLLRNIRQDRGRRDEAIGALDVAARDLSELVSGLAGDEPVTLDIRKFKGLLDLPADGPVSSGFGRVIHPRFKTAVPHPGWDIDAPEGQDIRAVFEGRVVFASWLEGYGLTAIVDHGFGLLSIYSHASALLVERDDRVLTGQTIGKIGDTGSLRGPHLYFELRDGGRPVDPAGWLRNGR